MAEVFGRTLGLIFEESTGGPEVSSPTMAQIYLQTFTTSRRQGFDEPLHLLTPAEYGPDVFDDHADQLIENIRALKREARAQFEAIGRRRR
jgi:hypothetical protein